jgi:hypothetical protein
MKYEKALQIIKKVNPQIEIELQIKNWDLDVKGLVMVLVTTNNEFIGRISNCFSHTWRNLQHQRIH